MPSMHIRKDDHVRVMAGKDRGKEGRVVRVDPSAGKVMVDGVALAKKHARAQGYAKGSNQAVQQGGIIDVEMFIDASNVQLVCKSCNEPTRLGARFEADGSKVRICRKCEADL